ncbi:hypothetical protein JCM6882_004633 [Rhodosporidiobolus microsporus]
MQPSYPTGLTYYPQDLLNPPPPPAATSSSSSASAAAPPPTPAPAPSTSTSSAAADALNKSRQPRVTRACDACRKRKVSSPPSPSPLRQGADEQTSSRPRSRRVSAWLSTSSLSARWCARPKVRCDGSGGGPTENNQGGVAETPCSLCQQQGIPCTFEQRITKRPPPKGYVESLERRLEAMESLLTSLSSNGGGGGGSKPSPSSSSTPGAAAHSPEPPVPLHAAAVASMGLGGPVASAPAPPPASSSSSSAVQPLVDSTDGAAAFSTTNTPERPPSPPQTGLDAIQRLGERLDDLVIETDRYVGRGSGLHLVYSVHEHLSLDPAPQREDPSLVDNLLHAEHIRFQASIELPPPDLTQKLVDTAFEQLQPWPMLVKEEFYECVRRGMVESNRGFKALYFAVCALGSRFLDDPRLDPPASSFPSSSSSLPSSRSYLDPAQLRIARGYQYFWASCTAASTPLVSATLYDIQADVIAILWLLGSTGLITSWTAVGFAIRRAIDVGAHREGRTRWNTSPLQDQQRKRAFHALLSLDRFISSMLGRPLSIQEADFDVDVPLAITDDELISWDRAVRLARARGMTPPGPPRSILEDAFSRPPGAAEDAPPSDKPHYTVWTCAVELHSIMAGALSLLYGLKRDKSQRKMVESVCDLDSRLNRWLEMIPPVLTWHPSKMLDFQLLSSAWLHCAYYQCQILVHREFISPSRSRALGFPSLAICSNAARSCARVLDILAQRGLLEAAYSWAPVTAVTSGLMLILGVFANPPGAPGSPPATLTPSALADVQRCLNAMEHLSSCSFMALKCFEGFSRMAVLVAPGALTNLAGGSAAGSTPNGSVGTPVGTGAGVSPTATTAPRNPLTSSLKRANPDGGVGGAGDGDSPSSTMSASDKPSPSDSAAAAGAAAADGSGAHKARKVAGLPFSTHDLSSSTFNGRPTFAQSGSPTRSSNANAVPPSSFGVQYAPQQQQPYQPSHPFHRPVQQQQPPSSLAYPPPSPFFDFNDPSASSSGGGGAGLAEFDFSAFTDLPGFPLSFPPSSSSFSSSTGPGAFPPSSAASPSPFATSSAPSAAASTQPFPMADFWNLPFDEPSAVPPAVGQGFADLMANFGMPDSMGGGAGGGAGMGGTFGFGGQGQGQQQGGTAVSGAGYDPALFAGMSPFTSASSHPHPPPPSAP